MIGFPTLLLIEHVIDPQADPMLGERRAFRDPESRPVDVAAQEIDVRPLTTTIVGYEIGGSLTLRHTISVALDVTHGDPVEAIRLRDLIVLDLVRRAFAAREAIQSVVDEATGQYVSRVDLGVVNYSPLGLSELNESAEIPFVLDTQLDA